MLLVYPEGHRMGATTSVSKEHLKTGMMRVFYLLFSMVTESAFHVNF